MAFTSSTAYVRQNYSGTYYTYADNSVIVGDNSGDYIEIYGAHDSIYGNGGNDSIAALKNSSDTLNGDYCYINGGAGDDVLFGAALKGTEHVTLVGGGGTDTFAFGCNRNATISAVLADIQIGNSPSGFFYEGGTTANFVCNIVGNDMIVNDDAGRLNVTIQGINSYGAIENSPIIFYPYGLYYNNITSVGYAYVYGMDKTFGSLISQGGIIPAGINSEGKTLTIQ